MSKVRTYAKMAAVGATVMIGGPALTYYVMPDPDELFKRYNPDLQRRSLAERDSRLQAHQEFLSKLEKYSKSDKPIWQLAMEDQKKQAEETEKERKRIRDELELQKQEILAEQRREVEKADDEGKKRKYWW